jgi:hypothetical protein
VSNNTLVSDLDKFANLRSVGYLDDDPTTSLDESLYSLVINGTLRVVRSSLWGYLSRSSLNNHLDNPSLRAAGSLIESMILHTDARLVFVANNAHLCIDAEFNWIDDVASYVEYNASQV